MLYPLSFLLALLGLRFWFFYEGEEKKVRLAQIAFFLGFGLYLLSLGIAEVTWARKLFLGFRDLVIMSLLNWVLILVRMLPLGNRLLKVLKLFPMLLKPKTIIFWSSTILLVGIFYYFVSGPMAKSLQATDRQVASVPVDESGEWLVEMESNADLSLLTLRLKGLAKIRTAFEPMTKNGTVLDDYLVIDVLKNDQKSINQIGEILKASGQVNWIEPNEVIQLAPNENQAIINKAVPNLGVDDPEATKQWAMDALGMKDYYAFLRKRKIKIKKKGKLAILDTGVDSNHEDLKENFVSIEKRFDNDPQGHGTHCAGIAGAVTNNGVGIASFGLSNNFYSITSVKVLNANGMGTQESIIDGIIKAADNGATVISMSLGGRVGKRKQKAYEKAVKYANKKGAIIVVAAGNENRNATSVAPANVPGVITVSAIDSTLSRALFSNNVSDLNMGIAAPGVAIFSTLPNNQYKSMNGTSMATPYVAGLVAIMKSINPKLKTNEIYDILSETGKKTQNPKATGPLIQPEAVLKALF